MRVYLTSPWIPEEWVAAHGHEPRALASEEGFGRFPPSLAAGMCPFAEWIVQFAETHADCAVVFPTSCDQLRRGFDAVNSHHAAAAFLFNIPATPTPVGRQIYKSELERLGQFLCQLGGHSPAPERLREEMIRATKTRKDAAASPARRPDSAPSPAVSHHRVNLALVGGPVPAARQLFDAIEAAGGRIVLDATEYGERRLSPLCDAGFASGDPFEALVDACFGSICDVFQRPNHRLYAWLEARLNVRGVRGVVLWHFTGCDLWRAEAQTLREKFGVPILLLEGGAGPGLAPRDTNRIGAFVEMLR